MSHLITHLETDQLIGSIDCLNTVLQTKNSTSVATPHQLNLLKIAHGALYELNSSLNQEPNSWAIPKIEHNLRELQKEVEELDAQVNWWVHERVETLSTELTMLDCLDLIVKGDK